MKHKKVVYTTKKYRLLFVILHDGGFVTKDKYIHLMKSMLGVP